MYRIVRRDHRHYNLVPVPIPDDLPYLPIHTDPYDDWGDPDLHNPDKPEDHDD